MCKIIILWCFLSSSGSIYNYIIIMRNSSLIYIQYDWMLTKLLKYSYIYFHILISWFRSTLNTHDCLCVCFFLLSIHVYIWKTKTFTPNKFSVSLLFTWFAVWKHKRVHLFVVCTSNESFRGISCFIKIILLLLSMKMINAEWKTILTNVFFDAENFPALNHFNFAWLIFAFAFHSIDY